MKTILLATAASFALTSGAFAGNLAEIGLDDPVVRAPAPPVASWTGAYAGISYGQTTSKTPYTTSTPQSPIDEYETWYSKECAAPNPQKNHDKNKCGVTEFDWGNSPEIQALEEKPQWGNTQDITNPPGEPWRYEQGYYGIWMNGAKENFVFTTPNASNAGRANKGANTNIVEAFEKLVSSTPQAPIVESGILEQTSQGAGAFVGYRQDFGTIVGGVEGNLGGDLSTLEAQAGLDMGAALSYVFVGGGKFDGESGTVYGAGIDVKINDRWLVGAKYTVGEFGQTDTNTAAVRFGIQF